MANYVSKYTGAEIEAILEASSTKLNSNQTANYVLAAPNGSAGKPTFRKLVAADIPSLAASKITSGTFDAARIPSLNASKITAGTLSADRIPTLNVSKISGLATVTSNGLMSKEDKYAIADISRTEDSEGNYAVTAIPFLNVTDTLYIKGTDISSLFASKSIENILLADVGDDLFLISQSGANPTWIQIGDIIDYSTVSAAPTSHASTAKTYGCGTTTKYGHVKIHNGDVNTVASADGVAAGMDHSHGNYALTTKLPKFSLSGTVLTITDNS